MTFPDFPEWFKDLCSDVRWYENTLMTEGKGKDFKKAAQHIYNLLLADVRIRDRDMIENRKHVYNKLGTMKPEQVFPQLQQVVKEEPKEEWIPVSDDERTEWLKKWQEEINKCTDNFKVAPLTAKEKLEQQGWRPKPEDIHEPSHHEKVKAAEEHLKVVMIARTKMFREKYPNGTTKDLQKYLKSFKHLDNQNGI